MFSCNKLTESNKVVGTWQLVYAKTVENDSVKIKDLSNTEFVKIINDTHFAFFNQQDNGNDNFYGGAGTYVLQGDDYVETLNYTSVEAIKNHRFPFKVQVKGDSLIQTGIELVKEAGINRQIIEKYIRVQ